MGFKTVYLIGMDFDYKEPETLIKDGNVWQSTEIDPNHFDDNYFGPEKDGTTHNLKRLKLPIKSKNIFELGEILLT